jgi:tRNA threonylcarbamoyladenosine biosynthesis protein TsaE
MILMLYCNRLETKRLGVIINPSMKIVVNSEDEMKALARRLGASMSGGELIELVGDVGAGKTTFVKGLAVGLDICDDVQSPSYTINRIYQGRDGLVLSHYDFYRLESAGVMSDEIDEASRDNRTIVVIEWADTVKDILPEDKLTVSIEVLSDTARALDISTSDEKRQQMIEGVLNVPTA